MWQNDHNKPWEPEPDSHQKIYLLNGKLLNYAIKVWLGLMIGITALEMFAPKDGLNNLDMLKIKFIVLSMVAVMLLGTLPWLINSKETWRFATSESGTFQGICNRCAAFLPFVGLIILFFTGVFWILNF
jgi:dolichyl-phosphate-mannose--protein O-mannosyl transferase